MPVLPRFDLRAFRTDALRFARAFPSVTSTLGRPVSETVTERLVDGVGFLGGTLLERVADFQQSAHEMLAERASPWLRRPIPAATVVAFEPPSAGRRFVDSGVRFESAAIDSVRCTFLPVRPLVVTAYHVTDAALDASLGRPPVVRITVESTAAEPVNEPLREGLTLYIGGELENALRLVHALTCDLGSVTLELPADEPRVIASAYIERLGLRTEDSLARDPDGMPAAFGVVTEAFLFPHGFRFVRVAGLDAVADGKSMRKVTLAFTLRAPLRATSLARGDVRAHCAVLVNLFEAYADPIPLDLVRGSVPIRIAGLPRRAGGVYAVEEARAIARIGAPDAVVLPDLRRLAAARGDERAEVYFATRFDAQGDDDPEMTIAFERRRGVGFDGRARDVSLRLLATNRAVAGRLREGDLAGEQNVDGGAIRYRNVVGASPYVPPPTGRAFALRATRLAALRDGFGDPLAALQRMLFLSVPSWTGSPELVRAVHARIEGLRSLEVAIAHRSDPRGGIRRGYAYRLGVDEAAFRGPGDLGLFGACLGQALERSLAVNTFVELTVVGTRSGGSATFPSRPPQ
jgi:type VI secretion system protein ImpG